MIFLAAKLWKPSKSKARFVLAQITRSHTLLGPFGTDVEVTVVWFGYCLVLEHISTSEVFSNLPSSLSHACKSLILLVDLLGDLRWFSWGPRQ